jgi:hypothetical protein
MNPDAHVFIDRDTGQALDGRDLGKDWPVQWHAICQQVIRPAEPRCKTPPPDSASIESSIQAPDMEDGSLFPAWDPSSRLLEERSLWAEGIRPTPSFGGSSCSPML